jgi:DNA invertase Pin-like site-specific DNA recombinase
MNGQGLTRVGLYVRMSTDRKAGIRRQTEDCEAKAAALGWTVVDVYADNDVSAVKSKVRPEYERMLEDIERGVITGIIVWHPDRLYRRPIDLETLMPICQKHGVQIETVNAGTVDLATPTGRLIAGMLGQVARFEGEHKAERWKRSDLQRRKDGIPWRGGSRMFGYTRDGELVDSEVALIRKAAADLIDGVRIADICREWNSAGVRTTRDGDWCAQSLKGLLRNPRLAGWVTRWVKTDNGRELVKVSRSTWPAILTDEEHEQVNAYLTARSKTLCPKGTPRKSILLGIIHCGVCGTRLETGGRNDGQRTYRCPAHQGSPGKGCVQISAANVETMVEGYAKERLSDPRVGEELARLHESGSDAARQLVADLANKQERLAELQTALTTASAGSVAMIVAAAERLQAEIVDVEGRLASLVPVARTARKYAGSWPEDFAIRRDLIALVVARVDVDRPNGDKRFRGGPFRPDRVRITPA